ncbi:hypothetical protein D3C73_508390 [compost metagenome]
MEYRSVDKAGNVEASKTIVIRIDKQGPVITLPTGAKFYQTDASLPAVKVEDTGSGVNKTVYTLDGKTVTDLSGVAPWTLQLGKHSLKVVSTDAAGNTTSSSFTIEETIDLGHLDELVNLGASNKWITKQTEVKKLLDRVTAIQQAKNKQEKIVRLAAFGAKVASQTGKTIAPIYSALVLADLVYIGKQVI